ncbi:YcfL family protein [Veronia pacifica]|uniref:YcfL protein: an outer membrane lipoprotein that is part of a salvage cluster n=1 Tax=Veronia pacifica TaxID=1080227 RepID=A0A1C3EG26_9GAMM|nr:YcfL family protein [Veronia pacifica]ODA32202.1 hypothetical protein A8L45_14175 [Veronia pacifica]
MRYLAAALSAAILIGCSSTDNRGISIDSSNQHVVLANSSLGKDLEFGNAQANLLNERLNAQVRITNKTGQDQAIQYKFDWYDAQGLEVDSGKSPWRQLIIYAGDSKVISGMALHPAARDFRVSVRHLD